MNKKLLILLFLTFNLSAQTVDVTEMTLKVPILSEEVFYYGFAEGDQIILNFTEINGKDLKEVEVIEYPKSSKFSDFKTSKIENKVINVNSKSVYKFRFYNSSIGGRICKIKIQRIPQNDKFKTFNTSVKWKKEKDTTWNTYTNNVMIGFDTLKIKKTRRVVESEQKIEDVILDKSQRVHSSTNSNGKNTSLFFTLPKNISNNLESKKVIAWAYWVGVGEQSNIAWQENRKAIIKAANGIAGLYTTPLGALAVGTVTSLILPSNGEDVSYSVVDEANKNLFMANTQYMGYDHGKGIAGYKRFTDQGLMQGTFFIVMSNDNYLQGIDVNVKVSVIVEHKKFKDEVYFEEQLSPKYEKQTIKEPIVTVREFPVTFDSN